MRARHFSGFDRLERFALPVCSEFEKFVDTLCVAAAVEGRRQKYFDELFDHVPTRQSFRKREHVAVVVMPRELRRIRFEDRRAAHARHFIGRDRYPQTRSAYDDAALRLSGRNRFADRESVIGIINRRIVPRAKIRDVMPLRFQLSGDPVFVFETGMIGGDGDFQSEGLSCGRSKRRRLMKLACTSSAFDLRLKSGDLTQLEWLDLCARELAADGIVCDVRHFPRRDSDYLAQLKKMAVDLGLCIAAVSDEEFFSGGEDAMRDVLAIADALGAPILAAPLAIDTAVTWSEELERLGTATSLAKTSNVTLAVRNRPKTFAAASQDLKRVSKEADSAWLRYALEYATFDGGSEPAPLLPKTVLLWHTLSATEMQSDEAAQHARMLEDAQAFLGFLVLDAANGSGEVAMMRSGVRKWRTILAEDVLAKSIGG